MDELPAAGLVAALERAAELEHAVLLQYLFAAASLKRAGDGDASALQLERIRGWERTLLLIAREEMAHLAAVSNLLIAVGSTPWLVRPGLPGGRLGAAEADRVHAQAGRAQAEDALVLERFCERSLARFIGLEREESGEGTISGHYAAIKREIRRLDAAGYQVVRDAPVDRVDGWGIGGSTGFRHVTGAADAIEVIDAIVGQGAGRGGDGADSHLQRLLAIEAGLAREEGGFDPARRVAANPILGTGAGTPIGDPSSAGVAAAFAGAYQAMVLLLELYYALVQAGSPAAIAARRAVQGLMSGVLRPLGEVLGELPVGEAAPGWSCGPTFAWDQGVALAADRGESWRTLRALLAQAGASLAQRGREGGPPRLAFIAENLVLAARLVARGGGEDA